MDRRVLQRETDQLVKSLGRRAGNAKKLIRALYVRPLTDADRVARVTALSMTSAYKLIDELEKKGYYERLPVRSVADFTCLSGTFSYSPRSMLQKLEAADD